MDKAQFEKMMKREVVKFNSLSNANSFANRAIKAQMVILGDDGKFWVARPKITEQLFKMGYEYAL